ncbi:interferon alpha-inducible protein 27-like [Silurus meridionalis]|nr:interferon alpha-inducible protein 27-like [Silurus meridionalis]
MRGFICEGMENESRKDLSHVNATCTVRHISEHVEHEDDEDDDSISTCLLIPNNDNEDNQEEDENIMNIMYISIVWSSNESHASHMQVTCESHAHVCVYGNQNPCFHPASRNAATMITAAVGAAFSVLLTPFVISSAGFTSGGIAAGSIASSMMSSAAIANGGGVASGSLVATLQSLGNHRYTKK